MKGKVMLNRQMKPKEANVEICHVQWHQANDQGNEKLKKKLDQHSE
jgi:hypothetical protein